MQYAVNDHFSVNDFKIDSVVLGHVTVKRFAVFFHFAETGVIQRLKHGFGNLEFSQQVQLFQRGNTGYFRGTDFIEDDLKHAPF